MEFTRHFGLLALSMLAILALYGRTADACMCMPSHPQTHYCSADYVVQLRVLRKSNTIEPGKTIYKVHIKRTYKATPEARRMLRDGRLSTPNDDAMCGIQLDTGKVYIIAGRMPQLNVCAYYKEYTKMTISERHGFSGAYGLACTCNISTCFGRQCLRHRETAEGCKWSPFGKCERDYSSCVPHHIHTRNGDIQRCRWRRTQLYKKCLSYP
ncbi:tissue inhibitor of metalloproteinase [Drosophila sulfurigaster albostrigata]|uniref:Tissue inhibitor of metalloproteinase n=1 Tax=Drosophila albomicans TaxID=7291 RepID=A0A6P8XDV9_DROAB|nr:tissue inhibitor of metalloproteinase [Drosophila albomicans]XP_034114466.1 tissue inhibitor of metalloproteinase [Drosophila albomicans]XP_060649523.1 tissue inhibitor of metalloproteinase [Drosophila nasuta]XP_062124523.1 tissue inhibitor of metalloproteinase [Drosophila sulfurigaster albostrigata]XP_062124524.1 tissue inhibitor of metalloproteinase [Drosophila sulfurigaster albostrigata]